MTLLGPWTGRIGHLPIYTGTRVPGFSTMPEQILQYRAEFSPTLVSAPDISILSDIIFLKKKIEIPCKPERPTNNQPGQAERVDGNGGGARVGDATAK